MLKHSMSRSCDHTQVVPRFRQSPRHRRLLVILGNVLKMVRANFQDMLYAASNANLDNFLSFRTPCLRTDSSLCSFVSSNTDFSHFHDLLYTLSHNLFHDLNIHHACWTVFREWSPCKDVRTRSSIWPTSLRSKETCKTASCPLPVQRETPDI